MLNQCGRVMASDVEATPDEVVIVVVTHNSAALLPDLVTSLPAGTAGVPWRLVVVDNGSTDGTPDVARGVAPEAVVVEMGRNAGYAAGINAGVARLGTGRAVLVLNPDVRLEPGCVPALLGGLAEPGTGVTVPRLVDGHGVLVPSMRREPTVARAVADALLGADRAGRIATLGEVVARSEAYDRAQTTDWAEGSTQLVSAQCWRRCGPWDESFFLYSEETEFHLRVRDHGMAVRYVPGARAVHLGGDSTSSPQLWSLLVANRVKLFAGRHGKLRTGAFWAALLAREASRALLGRVTSRRAVSALVSPSRLRARTWSGVGRVTVQDGPSLNLGTRVAAVRPVRETDLRSRRRATGGVVRSEGVGLAGAKGITVAVRLAPITSTDLPAVARFLTDNLNRRVPPARWMQALSVPWGTEQPNHGFHLRDAGGTVVGAYLAYYSEQLVDGRPERFCNLGAWCVLDGHRHQGVRLLTRLLAQRDLHFTDFSPSGNVIELNRRLKFADLDTTTDVVLNTPGPVRRGMPRVSSAPEVVAGTLTAHELALYHDHRRAAAVKHLVVRTPREHCYVVFRRDTRKRVRAFGSILHVSNPELFRASSAAVGSHLLTRYGVPSMLVERRVARGTLARGTTLTRSRPKMFRSPTLSPDQVGYLYSELACLPW